MLLCSGGGCCCCFVALMLLLAVDDGVAALRGNFKCFFQGEAAADGLQWVDLNCGSTDQAGRYAIHALCEMPDEDGC